MNKYETNVICKIETIICVVAIAPRHVNSKLSLWVNLYC